MSFLQSRKVSAAIGCAQMAMRPIMIGRNTLISHRYMTVKSLQQITQTPENEASESKELILSVLRSNATRRDAKAYISRYTQLSGSEIKRKRAAFVKSLLRSVRENSVGFDLYDSAPIELKDTIRVSIIKIRVAQDMDEDTLQKIGTTIARLKKLGSSPIVVLDPSWTYKSTSLTQHEIKRINTIANFIVSSIEGTPTAELNHNKSGKQGGPPAPTARSQVLPPLFSSATADSISDLSFSLPHLLLLSLANKIIPVVTPLLYVEDKCTYSLIPANEAVYQIVKPLSLSSTSEIIAVDKVIFIDPLGGIPSYERKYGAHILVNMEQEYDSIITELQSKKAPGQLHQNQKYHVQNLDAFKRILALSPTTSGLITTPLTAASQSTRNPLIYNLLTDRPVISSSLPVAGKRATFEQTTLLRHGVPVMMLFSEEGMSLPGIDGERKGTIKNKLDHVHQQTADVDMRRLVNLIEDSFGRELNLNHYLKRVNGNIAGIIIAGDYEGAAIITWEKFESDPNKKVAYLDKFAVLRKSQGATGVADIVFKAMVMQLFPNEILWRSRTENPVNRWYFDRAKGTIKLPTTGQKWTMYWTGDNTREEDCLNDYIHICSSIEPSFKH
ncbi:hypothetical protein V1514DRAFT_336566 [Lipomyces japonicus]|uniref:uncharacterized protein n=1 Tax=Lipomyces japonicus TaxID=56871 RepID=UPI0034CE45C7